MGHRAKNIYYLELFRTSLLTPDLDKLKFLPSWSLPIGKEKSIF
jgi:hypothetical protein